MEPPTALEVSISRFMHWGRTHAQFLGVSIAIVWSTLCVGAKYQRLRTERELLRTDINHQRKMFEVEARIEAVRADAAQQKAKAIQQCHEKLLRLGYAAEYKTLQQNEQQAPIERAK